MNLKSIAIIGVIAIISVALYNKFIASKVGISA